MHRELIPHSSQPAGSRIATAEDGVMAETTETRS